MSEFSEVTATMPTGEQVAVKLAERGSWIGGRSEGLWVREIRKRTESGHQTSLISSAYRALAPQNAAACPVQEPRQASRFVTACPGGWMIPVSRGTRYRSNFHGRTGLHRAFPQGIIPSADCIPWPGL